VLGHRGARLEAPENTLRAFRLALTQGADGVELDVRLAADSEPVVIHDANLERVTQGADQRTVEHVESHELKRVDVGAGEGVPRLSEVLDWAVSSGAKLNVEIKHDGRRTRELVRRVSEVIGKVPQARELVLLSCFHPGVVKRLSRLLPELPVGWLVHSRQRAMRSAPGWRLLGAVAVHPELVLATPVALGRWRRAGALIAVWTVNEPEQARRLGALGIDALISDCPAVVVRALRTSLIAPAV
jgi:glycerophosphoryl diester phosphodiesterase